MFDINQPVPPPTTDLAKAHPAQDLISKPGWSCPHCQHKNPIHAPFCTSCDN